MLARLPVLARGLCFRVFAPAAELSAAPSVHRAEHASVERGLQSPGFRRPLPFLDPEVEFEGAESLIGGFSVPDMRGRARPRGLPAYVRRPDRGLDGLELHPEEVIDLGDRLLGVGRATGHGRLSGSPWICPCFRS